MKRTLSRATTQHFQSEKERERERERESERERERSRGSKLGGAYEKGKSVIIEQSNHTITSSRQDDHNRQSYQKRCGKLGSSAMLFQMAHQ